MLCLLAILAGLYIQMFFGRILFTRDIAHWILPARWLVYRALRAGELPLWNPYQGLGFPVFGWSRSRKSVDGIKSFAGESEFAAFLGTSDFLICLVPLTPETKHLITAHFSHAVSDAHRRRKRVFELFVILIGFQGAELP